MNRLLAKIGLGLVGTAAVVSTGLAFYGQTDRERFEDAKAGVDADCARFAKNHSPDEALCHPFQNNAYRKLEWKAAVARVESARSRVAWHDSFGAVADLRAALDGASDLDRRGTPVAQLFAAKIVNETLDILERDKGNVISDRSALSLLEGRRFRSAVHPLETERLHVASMLLDGSQIPAFPARPFTSAVAAQGVEEENRVIAAMEHAIDVGDADACVAAAHSRGFTRDLSLSGDLLCSKLIGVARTNARLRRTTEATAKRLRER